MMTPVLLLALLGVSSGFLLDREVCYGDLGCFNTQTVRSFSRPIVLLPDEPAKIGTRFFLYTRQNPNKNVEQELTRKDLNSLTDSTFNASRDTKIIIHGFTHSAHEQWVQDMKTELLKYDDYNVIAVDWRQGATFPYTQATANIRVVAAELVKLLEFLFNENPGLTAGSIHMIGHSLGAHAASEVGTKIKRIGRISGLDPAEPYFEGAVEDVRLEKRDAEFVDIIHTDGSAFLGSLGMGYRSSVGHVDFYPNGGAEQPGCEKTALSRIISSASTGITDGVQSLKKTFSCSHDRSIYYYIESINNQCPFTGYPCKSFDEFKSGKCLACPGETCSRMGFHADKYTARGDFYLLTNPDGKQPFCSYHYRIAVTAGVMTDKGYGKVTVSVVDGDNKTFGPIEMTEKPTYLEARTKLEKLVASPKDIGNIAKVGVTYKKDNCLSCFLYTDFFRLQSVEVDNGEEQKRTTFCGKNLSVATDQYRVFSPEAANRC